MNDADTPDSTSDDPTSVASPEALAARYRELAQDKLPAQMGFSARLNMLWDLAGIVPSQVEGRVLALHPTPFCSGCKRKEWKLTTW